MKVIKPDYARPSLMGMEVRLLRFATDQEEGFDPYGDEIPCAVVALTETGEEVFVWMDEVDLLARLPHHSRFAMAAQKWLDWAGPALDPSAVESHLERVADEFAGDLEAAIGAVLAPVAQAGARMVGPK